MGRPPHQQRVIWDKSGNPTRHVSDVLQIERWQLREAIHATKAKSNLLSTDKVVIYDNGDITDTSGDVIGNAYDEI